MKKILYIIVIAILALPAHASHISRQKLTKGEAVSIETEYEIGDVAVANHQICDFMITESRREIYLNPREEGVTTITVWDAEGRKRDVVPVEVYKSNLDEIVGEAKLIFKDTNVEIEIVGRDVILSGEATSKTVLEKANSFASRYQEVISRVMMSGEVMQAVAEKIQDAIKTPGVTVRNVRGTLVIEGVAFSSTSAKRAVEIAKLYEPNIINLLDIKETGRRPGKDKLVQLDIYFMEIKKEALRTFGVNWAPGSFPNGTSKTDGSSPGGVAGLGKSLIGFVFNLIPKIRFLRERGHARVLDHATLVVKSGESADLFNGTQVPFYSGDNITFKDVGINIHAEPIATKDAVDLILNANISSPSANIDAGIDTRKISTNAYVNIGRSVVLANMVSNREVSTYNKKPTNIDTSSAFFNLALSKDFQSGRSEFMVFIMPTVIEQASSAEEKLKEYFETEKDMIKSRSKKEYAEFMKKRGHEPEEKQRPKRRRRKW